ncbi:ATP-binding cassette domain-containing protein [bacterium]|nr:MAG: ATP-binding cassette domain-containing protein [bacterium]
MDTVFIRGMTLDVTDQVSYPFSIPAVKAVESLDLSASPVTYLVGENGSGKSTIIESIAVTAGFNAEGGTKNYHFTSQNTTSSLSQHMSLIRGFRREKHGYFLRAESFYTTANYAENGTYTQAGPSPLLFDGKHIHEQSHGEAFLSIVKDFKPGLYIFDEPESALSPQRQLSLLAYMNLLVKGGSQFIIATHSPILLAYPGASIYELSSDGVSKTAYDELEHVRLTKDFLNHPTRYMQDLFTE